MGRSGGEERWRERLAMPEAHGIVALLDGRAAETARRPSRGWRRPRKRFAKDTVLIVNGTPVPGDHTVAERSKDCRWCTDHQVVMDAGTRLVVVVGRPLAGNRDDRTAWEGPGAKTAVGKALTIADGGYPGTGLFIPPRRERGQAGRPARKEEHNKTHQRVRARVEHVFTRIRRSPVPRFAALADRTRRPGARRPVRGRR